MGLWDILIYPEDTGCRAAQVSRGAGAPRNRCTHIHLPSPLLEPGCFPSRHSELPPALSHVKMSLPSRAWCHTPTIPALGRLTQDCCEPDLCNESQAADVTHVGMGTCCRCLGASLIHGGTGLWHRKANPRTSISKPWPPLPTPRSHLSREGGTEGQDLLGPVWCLHCVGQG